MRVAFTKVIGIAGVAALMGAPFAAVSAQNPHDSSYAAVTAGTAPNAAAICGPDIHTGATLADPVATAHCSNADPAIDATAAVTPGVSLHSTVTFNGTSSSPIAGVSFGQYFRILTFQGNGIAEIEFTTKYFGQATMSNDVGTSATIDANFQWGTISGGIFQDAVANSEFSYTRDNPAPPGVPNSDFSTPTTGATLTMDVDPNDPNLGGDNFFYYQLLDTAIVDDEHQDPMGTADLFMLEPTITFLDANGNDLHAQQTDAPCTDPNAFCYQISPAAVSSTPEPASVALVFTGLLGVGGFARRKRGRANAA